uniref:RNA-binding protein Musashi Rbp6 n=1 Tax=Anthurium amnicola TaxID=1678845 RepID=A0A1D1XK76_9ARAE
MMESDLGKLFIGGISWDTNEERLREYFMNYGEVVEAVIMKDRTTGRARGFGFVVFADPVVAERVLMEKHTIDGRMVEAKKAVPRDDHHILNRNSSSVHGSPSQHARTKKIFVGGLPSSVTETDFKRYFEQFGSITDAVVMYDHNTQRPRGFGFITYGSEDAVDKALVKTFHELNGKMVEVKRAVPKELSPGPAMRSPIGYNYGLRTNNFLNGYTQGYNPSSISGYGVRMDARFGPIASGRSGFPPFSPAGYGMGMNFEPGLSTSYNGITNYNNTLGFGRGMSPYYSGTSSRFTSPIGYGGSNGGAGSVINPTARNVWGNGGLSYATSSANANAFLGSGSGNPGGLGSGTMNWAGSTTSISTQDGGNSSGHASGRLGYVGSENSLGLGSSSYGRNSSTGAGINASYSGTSGGYEGTYADLYSGSSIYGDPTWRSVSSEIDGSGPFGYGLGNAASDVRTKGLAGYMEGYSVTNRQSNRGIAA